MNSGRRLICILGMHRSGTSCVTGSLQQAGLYLGNCHTWNPHNTKGNRENQDFVDLNDAVLAANGGAWDKPPKNPVWSADQLQRAKLLLEQNFSKSPLGFKDPRSLLVVDGWKRVYPDVEFVGVMRHPHAVARSLQKRSDMSVEQALGLWFAYNRVLLREYKKKSFPILCFDDDEVVFQEKLNSVVLSLELKGEIGEQRFYDDKLRTSNSDSDQVADALPWKIGRLYRRLHRRCV